MTEEEWLSGKYFPCKTVLKAWGCSARKLRLHAVACCRRIWDLLGEDCRYALSITELFADDPTLRGQVYLIRESLDETLAQFPERPDCFGVGDWGFLPPASHEPSDLRTWKRDHVGFIESDLAIAGYTLGKALAVLAVYWPYEAILKASGFRIIAEAMVDACPWDVVGTCWSAALARAGIPPDDATQWRATYEHERLTHVALLRDILGNPFHPISVDPSWLTWHHRTIVALAGAIYEERAFDRLPILADALEEAGCAEAAILEHCRNGLEHVRGCWVVDLLLGKE